MNLEQQRAAQAFQVAAGAAAAGEAEKFLSLTRSLPAMLQINGLLASWAFLLREAANPRDPAPSRVLRSLREAFGRCPESERLLQHFSGPDPLVGFLGISATEGPSLTGLQLRHMTAEALQTSVWLKRAAEALCDGATRPSSEAAAQAGQA